MAITHNDRLQIKHQRPCVLWLTGFSGAGKTTVANLVEREILSLGYHTCLLDGDNLRKGLCKDLGFSTEARIESIRRIGEVAKLFVDTGFIVIAATISPFQQMRSDIRARFAAGEFIEVFIDAPLAVCEQRDPKGLYRKARAGDISLFTGVNSAYDIPINSELHVHTDQHSPEDCANQVLSYLCEHGYLQDPMKCSTPTKSLPTKMAIL